MGNIVSLPVGDGLLPKQCKQARQLIRWQVIELADRACLSAEEVERFEAGETAEPHVGPTLRRTLERNGISWPAGDMYGRPFLDGCPFDSRSENGTLSRINSDKPVEEPGFRYSPLPKSEPPINIID